MTLCVCTLLLALAGCGGGANTLSEEQMQKLTPALQRIVEGKTSSSVRSLSTRTRPDGTTEYAVLLRVTDADAVREAGIPLNSVQGAVATARLSVDELRRAAQLNAVTRIEPSGQSFPTPSSTSS